MMSQRTSRRFAWLRMVDMVFKVGGEIRFGTEFDVSVNDSWELVEFGNGRQ